MTTGTHSPKAGPSESRSQAWARASPGRATQVEVSGVQHRPPIGLEAGVTEVRLGRWGREELAPALGWLRHLGVLCQGKCSASSIGGLKCLFLEPQVYPKGPAFPQGHSHYEKACHPPHWGRDGRGTFPLISLPRPEGRSR